jgi:ribosomal protein RSM22 (predicted rRNA methylase)
MTMAGIMGALTNMLIGGGMVALVRILPTLKQAANVRRKDDMDGLRDDIIAIKADAKEAKDEARRVSDIAQRLENMVACMRPAISILTAEVKRLDPNNPNNPALVQVQELMAMAASGDMGIGKAMTNIANIPAVGTP